MFPKQRKLKGFSKWVMVVMGGCDAEKVLVLRSVI